MSSVAEIDPQKTHRIKRFDLGTRLVLPSGPYRYCRAGERLKAGMEAYTSFSDIVPMIAEGHFVITKEIHEAAYDNILATGEDRFALGVPAVDVPKGFYCWIRTM